VQVKTKVSIPKDNKTFFSQQAIVEPQENEDINAKEEQLVTWFLLKVETFHRT